MKTHRRRDGARPDAAHVLPGGPASQGESAVISSCDAARLPPHVISDRAGTICELLRSNNFHFFVAACMNLWDYQFEQGRMLCLLN